MSYLKGRPTIRWQVTFAGPVMSEEFDTQAEAVAYAERWETAGPTIYVTVPLELLKERPK